MVSFPEYTGRTEKNYRDSIKTYAGETFYTNSKVQYALRKNTPIGHVFSKIHGQLTISANFKFENDYPNEIVSREKLQIHIYDKSTDQSCTIYIAQDGRITGSDLRKLPEEIKQEFIYAIEQVLPQILAAVPNPPSEPTLCNDLSHFGYSQALIDQCNQECSDAPDPNQCKLEFQKDQREQ
ncbi:MAG: hypothetical protein HQ596_07705 [Candidatus Saganbacteria bacterium]|nr:hypothetical protein [Candidatus Saganbacteria bacterium]